MQRLYSDSGTRSYEILGERYAASEWQELRSALVQLLLKRRQDGAVRLLERFAWTIVDGTNDFGDEFGILYARVPLSLYAENGHLPSTPAAREAAKVLAETITEITPERTYIRHVVFTLDVSAAQRIVSAPEPRFTSRAVQQALSDADRLLLSGSAVSAVDRVHTALMGFLRIACQQAEIAFVEKDGAAALLKKLVTADATLNALPHTQHTTKLLRSAGAILDAFDPLRNRASIAHPNEQLLEEAEALLTINIARSLFHYLDARLGQIK